MKKLDLSKFDVQVLSTIELKKQFGGGFFRLHYQMRMAWKAYWSAFENAGIAYDNYNYGQGGCCTGISRYGFQQEIIKVS